VVTPEPRRRRAVVLVGGPVAPYSRAIRIARALAAEGFWVEIAAVAGAGLPERESVPFVRAGATGSPEPPPGEIGTVEIRRYRPSGPWRFLGASDAAATGIDANSGGSPTGRSASPRRVLRRLTAPLLAVRRWIFWPHAVRGWWATLSRELEPADVYHACGALAIAAALAARDRHPTGPAGIAARVIYDAIDDVADSNETSLMPAMIRRRIRRRERAWARSADAVVTVNDALAARLGARYGRSADILVVPNYPEPGVTHAEAANRLRKAAGVGPDERIILFQGRLGPGLGLDAAAEAVLAVPHAVLVLMGFGRGLAASVARDRDPRFVGRHVTLPAVHPDELATWTAGADLVVIPLPPLSANQRDSTPNKFWEALAAGVPVVVVRGLREMERLVDSLDLGVVAASGGAEDVATAMRVALDRLAARGPEWRAQIAQTSAERFSWPATATAYRSLVRQLADPETGSKR
jgi:glycosyltransferase involved in cell wall biosynthesis